MNWEEALRANGLKIKHLRYNRQLIGAICYSATANKNGQVYFGLALVNPKDKYVSKSQGRDISFDRCMLALSTKKTGKRTTNSTLSRILGGIPIEYYGMWPLHCVTLLFHDLRIMNERLLQKEIKGAKKAWFTAVAKLDHSNKVFKMVAPQILDETGKELFVGNLVSLPELSD